MSNYFTKKTLLKISNLETEKEKIEVKMLDFSFGFAKAYLLGGESLPFGVQKDSF